MGNKIPILEHSTTLLQANHMSNVYTHNSGNRAKKNESIYDFCSAKEMPQTKNILN